MMDVVFIYLPHPYLKRPGSQIPQGLLMLAAVLKGRYDVAVRNYSALTQEAAIADLPQAALYGITCTSMELPYANDFAVAIKAKHPGGKVILGGPGTCTPEYIDFRAVDSFCVGEAELTIGEIVDDALAGRLRREYVGETVRDLDSLPFPAREFLPDNLGGEIFSYNRDYIGTGSTTILSSRGCPFRCAFCANSGGAVRFRSAASVRDEMAQVVERWGIRQFRFSDDMFAVSKRHALEICEAIAPLGVAWRVSIRTDPLDEEVVAAMRAAGCMEMSFGVESFDDDVLRVLNKQTTAAKHMAALEMVHRLGVVAKILMMIRTPGQTARTVDKNIAAIDALPKSIIACKAFVPLPGSPIWDDPGKYGVEILDRDLRNYNFYFFGPEGALALRPLIRLKDRSLDEFMAESNRFRGWLAARDDLDRG